MAKLETTSQARRYDVAIARQGAWFRCFYVSVSGGSHGGGWRPPDLPTASRDLPRYDGPREQVPMRDVLVPSSSFDIQTNLLSRRTFVGASLATATLIGSTSSEAAGTGLAARPPQGFVPLSIPGKIAKITKSNTMQANDLWPTDGGAKLMFQRVMCRS